MTEVHALPSHVLKPDFSNDGCYAFCSTRLTNTNELASYESKVLKQVHGAEVIQQHKSDNLNAIEADAVFTSDSETPCVIRTADCLPILLYSKEPEMVAAIHGGWRSLAAGIIPATMQAMGIEPQQTKAWLGPAIRQPAFEVGQDVYDAFNMNDETLGRFFVKSETAPDKYHADLAGVASYQLSVLGVSYIEDCTRCTYSEPESFYSYRRSRDTGRMYSVISLTNKECS